MTPDRLAEINREAESRVALFEAIGQGETHACNAYRIQVELAEEVEAQRGLIDFGVREVAALRERVKALEGALHDMHSGWRYIRRRYGELDGVGWDRCEESATAALQERST